MVTRERKGAVSMEPPEWSSEQWWASRWEVRPRDPTLWHVLLYFAASKDYVSPSLKLILASSGHEPIERKAGDTAESRVTALLN